MKYAFFTYNIDFHRSNSLEARSIHSIDDLADVMFFQEAKHLDVGRVLGRAWLVHQNTRLQTKQGVALAWRRIKVKRVFNKPGSKIRTPHGGYLVGVMNLGFKMLPRYINWRDLEFNGTKVRCIATHRPPQRFRRLWRIFDRALAAFVKRSPYPVIIGMDSNEATHGAFERQSGLVWRGIGIDGFYLSKSLLKHIVKGSLRKHPKSHSDHNPVSIKLDF